MWWDRHLACHFLIDRQDACPTNIVAGKSPFIDRKMRHLNCELDHLVTFTSSKVPGWDRIRRRPQPYFVSSGFRLQLFQFVLVFRIIPIPPRQPSSQKLLVEGLSIHRDPGYCPAIAIFVNLLNLNDLSKNHVRREAAGFVAECLITFGTVDAEQPNLGLSSPVHDTDGVAVTNPHHFAGPRKAETGKSEEENQDRTDKTSHASSPSFRWPRRRSGCEWPAGTPAPTIVW
jgi:hypothetical protein